MNNDRLNGNLATFEHMIASHYNDLRKYCSYLTSNKWEAEDLFQEALIKIFLALKQRPDRKITKRFLYQVARNAWIDHIRNQKGTTESFDEIKHLPYIKHTDPSSIREILEILAEFLTAKQFVFLLLVDVFQFTAEETAAMLGETTANIYTTLHRSRKKLKTAMHQTIDSKSTYKRLHTTVNTPMSEQIVESFLEGFIKQEPKLIYHAYLTLLDKHITIETIQRVSKSICFHFTDPDGHLFLICESSYKHL